jgi:transcriptional regulator with XRE-family HTH domain
MRDVLGITQQELAERTGMSRGSIANIETGRQRILLHDVETLARALGSSPKALMRGIWL